jgi:hypothetical protein
VLTIDLPIGLVVNPAARGVRRRHLGAGAFWRGQLPDRSVRVTGTLAELDAAVGEFRRGGVQVVASLGGDGSLHRLVDALARQYDAETAPLVLALAGGTMNGLAHALGSAGPPATVFCRVVAALAAGASLPTRPHHLLRVSDVAEGQVRHGFGFAAGLVYRAFQEYYRAPEPGLVDAVRASLLPLKAAVLGGSFYNGVPLEVHVNGAPFLPEPPHTLVASVTDNPFLWFRPFGEPLGNAAAYHLAALAMRPGEIAPRLWSIFRGRCRHPRLRVEPVIEASVRGETGYLIDGDLYPSGGSIDLRLSVGPRLQFIALSSPT